LCQRILRAALDKIFSVPSDMVAGKAIYEKIRVVIARLYPQRACLTPLGHRIREGLGPQQVKELIIAALVDQNGPFPAL